MKTYLFAGLLIFSLLSCTQKRPSWTPVMEQTSTVFLNDEVDRALAALQAIDKGLSASTRLQVQSDMDRLHTTLTQLQYYYLPMLKAREQAYNAYRFYYLGRTEKAGEDLDNVEYLLAGIADRGDGLLKAEMEKLREQAFLVEEAMRSRPQLASERYEQLMHGLNLSVLRGALILNGRDLIGHEGAYGHTGSGRESH